jgi:cytoskeletal protein RodZ
MVVVAVVIGGVVVAAVAVAVGRKMQAQSKTESDDNEAHERHVQLKADLKAKYAQIEAEVKKQEEERAAAVEAEKARIQLEKDIKDGTEVNEQNRRFRESIGEAGWAALVRQLEAPLEAPQNDIPPQTPNTWQAQVKAEGDVQRAERAALMAEALREYKLRAK